MQKKRQDALLKIDADLAREIESLSQESGASVRDILASLVWIGKSAFGRKIRIEDKEDDKVMTISSFEKLKKLIPLSDE